MARLDEEDGIETIFSVPNVGWLENAINGRDQQPRSISAATTHQSHPPSSTNTALSTESISHFHAQTTELAAAHDSTTSSLRPDINIEARVWASTKVHREPFKVTLPHSGNLIFSHHVATLDPAKICDWAWLLLEIILAGCRMTDTEVRDFGESGNMKDIIGMNL